MVPRQSSVRTNGNLSAAPIEVRDRLAIERIAALLVQQHTIRTERRSGPEQPADVVRISNTLECEHTAARGAESARLRSGGRVTSARQPRWKL